MDLTMDFIILAAAQFSLGEFRFGHLLLCHAAALACTLLAVVLGREFAAWLHLPLLFLCSAVVAGERSPGRILQCAAGLLSYCAAGAGFFLLGGYPAAVLGIALLAMLVRRSRNIRCRWNVEVEASLNGVQVSFPTLIDTGNRIREHASGLPVLIVEKSAAGKLADIAEQLDTNRKRCLPFGVLGGSGQISCFRCDAMHIILPGHAKIEAPPCWTAVYPGRIPGSTRALAPPEFADAVAYSSEGKVFGDRGRRIIHGIFKRKAIHLWFGGTDTQGIGLLHRRQRPASPTADP